MHVIYYYRLLILGKCLIIISQMVIDISPLDNINNKWYAAYQIVEILTLLSGGKGHSLTANIVNWDFC